MAPRSIRIGLLLFPLVGATVAFLPKNPKEPGASGRTDASGKYTLTAFAPGDGAAPGSYLVILTEVEGSTEVQEDSEAEPVPLKSRIPEKCNNPQGSGFTAEVAEGGDNQFTFELAD